MDYYKLVVNVQYKQQTDFDLKMLCAFSSP